jgi:hypothetical protein
MLLLNECQLGGSNYSDEAIPPFPLQDNYDDEMGQPATSQRKGRRNRSRRSESKKSKPMSHMHKLLRGTHDLCLETRNILGRIAIYFITMYGSVAVSMPVCDNHLAT